MSDKKEKLSIEEWRRIVEGLGLSGIDGARKLYIQTGGLLSLEELAQIFDGQPGCSLSNLKARCAREGWKFQQSIDMVKKLRKVRESFNRGEIKLGDLWKIEKQINRDYRFYNRLVKLFGRSILGSMNDVNQLPIKERANILVHLINANKITIENMLKIRDKATQKKEEISSLLKKEDGGESKLASELPVEFEEEEEEDIRALLESIGKKRDRDSNLENGES